jgi:two-component system LytT family response regulator
MRIIVIDESECKKELDTFIKKHRKHIHLMLDAGSDKATVFSKRVEDSEAPKLLGINKNDSIIVVNAKDIVRIESVRNYSQLYLGDHKKIVVSKSLMQMEGKLEKHHFIRIHKSHLININFLERFVKAEGGYVVMRDQSRLPVSTRKKELLFSELEKI